jgi:hypothetical protein
MKCKQVMPSNGHPILICDGCAAVTPHAFIKRRPIQLFSWTSAATDPEPRFLKNGEPMMATGLVYGCIACKTERIYGTEDSDDVEARQR